jgi:hypothetical protein
MPKTSMNKNGDAIFRQDNVRIASEVAPMESVPVTKRRQNLSHRHFRIRVARSDARHIPAAALC